MTRNKFGNCILFASFIVMACNNTEAISKNNDRENVSSDNSAALPATLNYSVIKQYPHNVKSFTEGLEWHDSSLYEGTGMEKESRLARVNLTSGNDEKTLKLDDNIFGEGITLLNKQIFQLTYRTEKAFVYDAATFKKLREFAYKGEGWGLTNNGKELIMSNGSHQLFFRNPSDFSITKTLEVADNNGLVANINELEYVDGFIYANIYLSNKIIKINSATGKVVATADFTGMLQQYVPGADMTKVDVMNGIAYDSTAKRFFVTGKYWPRVFEIKFSN